MSTRTIRESGDGLVASHVSVTDRIGRVIVDDVSVNARSGRTLVIVGESGAGKSMLARTLCALTPSVLVASGTVSLGGQDYDLAADQGRLKKQRGGGIVWLPQDPFTSLAPPLPGWGVAARGKAPPWGGPCPRSPAVISCGALLRRRVRSFLP